MIESYVRPIYQIIFVDPIASLLKNFIVPKWVTFAACILGICVAPLLLFNLPKIAVIFLLISGYLDTLDGTVARKLALNSKRGAILDLVSDRIVEFATILGLFCVDPMHRGFLTLCILGSCYICITSFLTVGIFTPNHSLKEFHYSTGIIERFEAFIFFVAMILLPQYFILLSVSFIVLVLLTSYLRIKNFYDLSQSFFNTASLPQEYR